MQQAIEMRAFRQRQDAAAAGEAGLDAGVLQEDQAAILLHAFIARGLAGNRIDLVVEIDGGEG